MPDQVCIVPEQSSRAITHCSFAVKHSRLGTLRAKNYRGSDEEWTQIVSYVLGRAAPQGGDSVSLSGVTMTATISGAADEDKEITLSIRKRIESITVSSVAHVITVGPYI